jgi:hypothetical protein
MIGQVRRYLARRRLRPVVSTLPRRLMKLFGASDFCTFGQAKRAIGDLRLSASVQPYAYAAVCRQSDLGDGFPLSADDYRRLREELADLFDLRSCDFRIKDLLATPYSSWNPAQETEYAG